MLQAVIPLLARAVGRQDRSGPYGTKARGMAVLASAVLNKRSVTLSIFQRAVKTT